MLVLLAIDTVNNNRRVEEERVGWGTIGVLGDVESPKGHDRLLTEVTTSRIESRMRRMR